MRYEPLLEKIRDNITVEACHELMVAIEADLPAPIFAHDGQDGGGLFPERWAEVRRAGEAYTKRQPQ